jgi:hypothetical protein
MFWSPIVPEGKVTKELNKLYDLELIINEKYTSCINELKRGRRHIRTAMRMTLLGCYKYWSI